MKTRKALATLALGVTLLGGGTAACGTTTGSNAGYVQEVEYGYYDSYHHYHYYSHPHTVRVTRSYYTSHSYQFQPHGTQHRVSLTKSTTTSTTRRSRLTGRTTTHTTTHTSTTTHTYRRH